MFTNSYGAVFSPCSTSIFVLRCSFSNGCLPTHVLLLNSQEYLQFEIDESEFGRARGLYERLLDRTKHLKVWISYAEFEASAGLGSEDSESEEKKNEVGYQEQQMERVSKCRGKYRLKNSSALSNRLYVMFLHLLLTHLRVKSNTFVL